MRIVEPNKIFEVIAEMRRESGLSVKDFGEKYGLTRPTMSNIVNGNTQPSRELCKELGIEIVFRVPAKSTRRRKAA